MNLFARVLPFFLGAIVFNQQLWAGSITPYSRRHNLETNNSSLATAWSKRNGLGAKYLVISTSNKQDGSEVSQINESAMIPYLFANVDKFSIDASYHTGNREYKNLDNPAIDYKVTETALYLGWRLSDSFALGAEYESSSEKFEGMPDIEAIQNTMGLGGSFRSSVFYFGGRFLLDSNSSATAGISEQKISFSHFVASIGYSDFREGGRQGTSLDLSYLLRAPVQDGEWAIGERSCVEAELVWAQNDIELIAKLKQDSEKDYAEEVENKLTEYGFELSLFLMQNFFITPQIKIGTLAYTTDLDISAEDRDISEYALRVGFLSDKLELSLIYQIASYKQKVLGMLYEEIEDNITTVAAVGVVKF